MAVRSHFVCLEVLMVIKFDSLVDRYDIDGLSIIYQIFHDSSPLCTLLIIRSCVFICFFCSDLLKNPLIVPLKILKGHSIVNNFGKWTRKIIPTSVIVCMSVELAINLFPGILDVRFHPVQPWLFTAGADSLIRLYT